MSDQEREVIKKILGLREAIHEETKQHKEGISPAFKATAAAAVRAPGIWGWIKWIFKKVVSLFTGKKDEGKGSAHDEVSKWMQELIKKILDGVNDIGIDLVKLIAEVAGCDIKKWPDYHYFNENDILHSVVQEPPPESTKSPETYDELYALLEDAAKNKQTVRAVSGGYVMSEVPFVKDLLLSLRKLKGDIPIDKSVLKNPDNEFLYQVTANQTIKEVNDALWEDQKKLDVNTDRIILNQTGFDGLSYIGAASTGAAGSGIRLGPMSNSILSIHLAAIQEVDGEAKVVHYRIEPTDGITDKAAFEAKTHSPEMTLIQEDEAFNAVAVSMGCMGVICSVIIETFPAHNIKEARYMTTWDEINIDALIKENKENKDMESFEVWIQPYVFEGRLPVVVTTRYVTTEPRHGSRGFLYDVFGDSLAAATLFWLLTSCEHLNWLVPFAMNESLKASVHKEIILPAPESRNLGPVNYMPGLATANFVDTTVVRESSQAIIDLYQKRAEEKHMYVNSPFSLRFTSPSNNLLSMSYDRDSVLIESVNLKETFGIFETMEAFQELLRGKDNFDGRTHWGLVFQGDALAPTIKATYKELDNWIKVWKRFNSAGLFVNQFTDQMFGTP